MRNIPMFVTENGAASLILEQIPYRRAAYVQLLDSLEPETMLKECCDFCRCAGAESVYAWGHPVVEAYPFYTSVLLYSGDRTNLQKSDFVAKNITEDELSRWMHIYNDHMGAVAASAWMTLQKAEEHFKKRTAYSVFDPDGDLCGIGVVEKDTVQAVISLYRGMGADILTALCQKAESDKIFLEVASSNERAVRLYNHQGFQCIQVLSDIHKIF